MPTYEYLCKNCGHTFEEFQSMVEPPLVRCPSCGTDNLARVMGTGGGVIFKGSGFYLTDYRKTQTISPGEQGDKEGKKKETDAKDAGKKGPEKKDGGTKTTGSPPAPPPPAKPPEKKD